MHAVAPENYRTVADRTNDTILTVALWYSVGSICTACIVAKRCIQKQKLLLRTCYRKSYMRNQLVSKWMTLTFV